MCIRDRPDARPVPGRPGSGGWTGRRRLVWIPKLSLLFLGPADLPWASNPGVARDRMAVMGQSAELGQFLRVMRARTSPEAAGLPTTSTARRVPGLRREEIAQLAGVSTCLLYTSPSPRDGLLSRMPSSA